MSLPMALGLAALLYSAGLIAANAAPKFRVIAFFTAQSDQAHISFVREATIWFSEQAAKHACSFDTTSNWDNLNAEFLSP